MIRNADFKPKIDIGDPPSLPSDGHGATLEDISQARECLKYLRHDLGHDRRLAAELSYEILLAQNRFIS